MPDKTANSFTVDNYFKTDDLEDSIKWLSRNSWKIKIDYFRGLTFTQKKLKM